VELDAWNQWNRWGGQWGESGEGEEPGSADVFSAGAAVTGQAASVFDLIGEGKHERRMRDLMRSHRRSAKSLQKKTGAARRRLQLRTSSMESQIAVLRTIVDRKRKARLALWAGVALLGIVALVAFRPPPTVRIATKAKE
jgi:hypothetical protein